MGEGKQSARRRRGHPVTVMLAAVLITGCANQSPAGPQSVGLSLVAPTDGATVNVRSVTVSGRVTPTDAHVRVAGHPAAVRKGLFHFRLTLLPRLNHIGISATAPGYVTATMETTVRYSRRHGAPPGQNYADRAERICTSVGDTIGKLPQITQQNVATVAHEVLSNYARLVRGLTALTVPHSVAPAYHRLVAKLQAGLPIAERGWRDKINGDLAGLVQAQADLSAIQAEPALYNEASRLDIPDCGGILDTGLHGP